MAYKKNTAYDPYAFDEYVAPNQLNKNNGAGNYAAYQAQVAENKKIANTPEATPGFGLYAQPVAVAESPYNAPASYTPAVPPVQATASGQAKTPTAMPISPYARYSSPYEKQAQTSVSDPFPYAKYTAPNTETAATGVSPYNGSMPTYGNPPTSGYAVLSDQSFRSKMPVAKTGKTSVAPSYANMTDKDRAKMKANNPALYNQLLVQGIIKAPSATTPSSASATDYSDYAPIAKEKSSVMNAETAPETISTPTESEYDKYYRENYGERERQIEADYQRSLANYGVQAEKLAQMGIHGGMSDYVNSAAYAQMQEQKAALGKEAYAEYAKHLDEKSAEDKSAEDANTKLYNLLRNGTYTDEDGNTVQGYDLLNMTDEQYNANKETYAQDLKGQGYTDEQISRAFSDIEATRAQNRAAETKRITDAFTKYKGGETTATEYLKELGVTDEQIASAAQNYAVQYKAENGKEISAEEAQSAVVGAAIIETVDNARKRGLLGEGDVGLKAESEFLRTRLPMYGDEYAATGWKDRGYTLADSIEDALQYKEAGMMTEADVKGVINDALDKMFGKKEKEVKYVNTGNSVKITLENGEMLKADYAGKASESASAYLNEKYPNCPIAVYDGKLYYRAYEHGNWMTLKTKGGITPGFNRGTPEQGDQYFYVVAYAMMQKNDYPAFEDKNTTYKLN